MNHKMPEEIDVGALHLADDIERVNSLIRRDDLGEWEERDLAECLARIHRNPRSLPANWATRGRRTT